MKMKPRWNKTNGLAPLALLSVAGATIAGAALLLIEIGGNTQQVAQAADNAKRDTSSNRNNQPAHRSTTDQVSRAIIQHVVAQSNGQLKNGKKPTVADLRKQYPFESLSRRLDYESRLNANRPQPQLTVAATKRLEQEEASLLLHFINVRLESLQALHSANAEQFIKQQGFGRRRMGFTPSPDYLPAPSAQPLPLAKGPRLTPDSTSVANINLPPTDAPTDAPTLDNPCQMPSRRRLLDLHAGSRMGFLSPATFGYVKSRDEVAGFESHAFIVMPRLHGSSAERQNQSQPKQDASKTGGWLIRKLELVSLLAHDTPKVYVSDHLPRMDELTEVKTRSLSGQERRGLRQLRSGEDIAIEAAPNVVRMVGSLRASKRCLECHSVQRGELLGAFTYLLQRDPPIRLQPPSDVPAT